MTKEQQSLRKRYGDIARALLHDPRVRECMQDLWNSRDAAVQQRLDQVRRHLRSGGSVSTDMSGPGGQEVRRLLRKLRLPHDWSLLVWTGAATQGERGLYPISPSPAIMTGEDGFLIGFSARQWAWWSATALRRACALLKGMSSDPSARGRPIGYLEAQQLEQEYRQRGGWSAVLEAHADGPFDATALRRRVERLRKRGYR